MSNTLLAWQNFVVAASTTLTAGSAEAGFPVTNLKNDIGSPSLGWQTVAGVKTAAAGATFTVGAVTALWRAFGLFRTNLTVNAQVSAVLKAGGVTEWSGGPFSPIPPYGQVVVVLPADTIGSSLIISIDDSTNPDGFINVPLAFGGPVWFPIGAASWNTTVGRDSQIDETVTRGGQEYPVMRWQRRRWNLALDSVRGSELWADLDALDAASRAGGNVLFTPDAASSNLQSEAIFGRLAATADVSFPYGFADRRAWRASLPNGYSAMTDNLDARVAALEVHRQNDGEDIRDLKAGMARVETKIGLLLDRDAQRAGRASLLHGLWPAVWLTIGGVAAAYLHLGGVH